MAAKHVALFLVLATAGTAAGAAENVLTDEMRIAARALAGELNKFAKGQPKPKPLKVAVRPARMKLGNIYVDCPPLSGDLQGALRAELDDARRDMGLSFRVERVEADVEAEVEVNAEWRLDKRPVDDADVMRVEVKSKVGGKLIVSSEKMTRYVSAERLFERQRQCLMRWKHGERYKKVQDGRLVTVFEYPVVSHDGGLKTYKSGEQVHVVGDLEPLGDGDGWHLVWVEEKERHGFATAWPQPRQPLTEPRPWQQFTIKVKPADAEVSIADAPAEFRRALDAKTAETRTRMKENRIPQGKWLNLEINLPPGTYKFKAMAEGYVTKTTEPVQHGSSPTVHEMVLEPRPPRFDESRQDESAAPLRRQSFTIMPYPEDAQVQLFTLAGDEIKYQPGMPLRPNTYHVKLSSIGWRDKQTWRVTHRKDRPTKEPLRLHRLDGEVFHDYFESKRKSLPMVVLPSEPSYWMGDTRINHASPVHEVAIQRFAMGVDEVKFTQWRSCVDERSCQPCRAGVACPPGWGKGDANRPVVNVTWCDAQDYVRWLSKKTKKQYRLLSESEWEYAARSKRMRKYSYRNVLEWVEDCWNNSYKEAPDDGSAWETGDCSSRILRGDDSERDDQRHAVRIGSRKDSRRDDIGFRVARTLPPLETRQPPRQPAEHQPPSSCERDES